ncbi:MAG: PEGA domain-containing protein, partial [Planctomycetota bacterium]|nr:PEGA domain-containing protein [Planctomycetota bacterium]
PPVSRPSSPPPAAAPSAPPATGAPTYPGTARPTPAAANTTPVKLAIFVRDVSPEVPDQKVSVLESYITSWLTNNQIQVINRAELLNAVSGMANSGANAGTGDPLNTYAERMLSDQSSAVALARNLGADGLLIATITSLVEDRRETPTHTNIFYTLDVTWNVLDGGNGGSVASGIAQDRDGIRQSQNLKRTFNVDTLLKRCGQQVGEAVKKAMAQSGRREMTAQAADVGVTIGITMEDMSVPEITKNADGEYIIGSSQYPMQPVTCNVMVDGMLVGSAPGTLDIAPGPHRIKIEHPKIVTTEKFMVVKPGMTLTIPVVMTPEARVEWMQKTAFFEDIKDGAMLREAELEKAKGLATFMRNSKINFDTSNVKTLGMNSPTVWHQWISD